ncbi:nadh dehydrogenase 1 beta subcomplex 7 [Nannochloropsis oceanica]
MTVSEVKATKEEMDKGQIDLALRDACAHLLIPLNKCRRVTFFLPWKCEDERHGYEACQYAEYRKRAQLLADKN